MKNIAGRLDLLISTVAVFGCTWCIDNGHPFLGYGTALNVLVCGIAIIVKENKP